VEEHQYLQKKIESAQKTSEIYNVALLALIKKLKSAEVELENVLSNAKIKLKNGPAKTTENLCHTPLE